MSSMIEPVKEIRKYLDKQEETRDNLLSLSNEIIRRCSRAMATLHKGEKKEVQEGIKEIRGKLEKLNKILDSEPQFIDHGAVIAANREFAELMLTKAAVENEQFPKVKEIDVLPKGYAQALAETIGELRRHFLDLLRKDEMKEAKRIYDLMEKIFDLLEQFDYPDSILPGMKHRCDVARKSLEITRADITRAVREDKLEKALTKTEEKLSD